MIRQTKQRQAILETVERSHDHPTAAQVFERVRQLAPGIGYATVYRSLRALADEGLLQEIHVGEVTQFDRRTDRHDHAVCQACGKLVDVEVRLPVEWLREVEERSGFHVMGYHTELSGLCAECR